MLLGILDVTSPWEFFKNRGGTFFEQELVNTQIALKKILENNISIDNIKTINASLTIGQDRTVINFPTE